MFLEINLMHFLGVGIIEEEKVLLIKPQTYMNLSGKSVIQFIDFYKLSLDDLIVVYNGMKSIVNILSDDRFPRVRVGIGKPIYEEDIINYVIGPIPEEDMNGLDEGIEKAKEAVVDILKNGIDFAMNKFN